LFLDSKNPFDYDEYNVVPFGVSRYKNKLFLTVPRRNPGIPATLNVVELIGKPPYINPLIKAFPSYQMNSLSVRKKSVSIFLKIAKIVFFNKAFNKRQTGKNCFSV
jgi:hypothetical protein